jgi:hypothetical protein
LPATDLATAAIPRRTRSSTWSNKPSSPPGASWVTSEAGKTYNINEREVSYKEYGIFVLVVTLCLCDIKILEDELKAYFKASHEALATSA